MKFWIKVDPKREQQVQKMYKIWKESNIPSYHLDVDESWNRLSRNIDKAEQGSTLFDYRIVKPNGMKLTGKSTQKARKVRKPDRWKQLILTATVAATIMIAFLFAYQYDLVDQEVAEKYTTQQYETSQGEWATYVLNDGSRVFLHPNSRLEVPGQFNVENRELFLEGEAYFEVVHDTETPFILNTKDSYTRVLGTKFLVQAWPESEAGDEVVVTEGRVALGSANLNEAVISRSQRGVLKRGEDPVVSEVDDLNWYLGWTEGRLVFDDRPLTDIISRLEYWYAVEIQLEDMSIGEKKITGEIDRRQPMNEVLTGISMSLDLEFENVDRTITFRFKKNSNTKQI